MSRRAREFTWTAVAVSGNRNATEAAAVARQPSAHP
jgi:hypothetical protein